MTTVRVFAPAKVNLTLHITGQRNDGYHLLDSLVSFATVGDWLTFSKNDPILTVDGDEAEGVPRDGSNLVLRAVRLVPDVPELAIHLKKSLPTAAGIGGGSADAAAAIRGAFAMAGTFDPQTPMSDARAAKLASDVQALGADVPMCLLSKPTRVQGIGDKLSFLQVAKMPMLLVNPRVSVPTGPVFKALAQKDNAPMPDPLPDLSEAGALINWLGTQRNDLQTPAIKTVPVIQNVIDLLATMKGCGLARMSGSGATCFGLFDSQESAIAAGHAILDQEPDWWMKGGFLGNQSVLSEPQLIRATT